MNGNVGADPKPVQTGKKLGSKLLNLHCFNGKINLKKGCKIKMRTRSEDDRNDGKQQVSSVDSQSRQESNDSR